MADKPGLTPPRIQAGRLYERSITIALAGQPNVGKTTVFNLLTGLSQHVGNWPGKTVELKVGDYVHNGTVIHLVDLPGTYSLTANSEDERAAREYIIREQPDAVICIVNAACLERSLYLLAELLCLRVPVVLGLNMIDVAEQQGLQIEPHVLEAALGLPVVPIIATKNLGVRDLIRAAEELAKDPSHFAPSRPLIREDHQAVFSELYAIIAEKVPEPFEGSWIALKLLEGDDEITSMMRERLSPEAWDQAHAIFLQHEDAGLAVAGSRYEWIRRMMRAAVIDPPAGQITLTDRLDRIATHPLLGLFLLVGIFGLVYWLTYTLASPAQAWLDRVVVAGGAQWVRQALHSAPTWLVDLLAGGVFAGVGTVLTLLPILVVFYALLALLEDMGYLARAAYVMDRFMHPMGLHGKSCLVLCMGFGCNVPAVLGARVVESERARLMTILLTPLVPCAGRLAVLAFLTPIFFPGSPALVSFSLVALNLLVLAGIGMIANRALFHGEQMAFIMELPLYHVPNFHTISLQVWHQTLAFVRNAGTIILAVSILVWFLAFFPGPSLEASLLAGLGRLLAPLGRLVGLDWRMMVALLTSVIAKENTIAALGVLYRTGGSAAGLSQALAGGLSSTAALAFLVVQMLFIPCAATVAVMRQELKSWRWVTFGIAVLLLISFGTGVAVYQAGMLFQ